MIVEYLLDARYLASALDPRGSEADSREQAMKRATMLGRLCAAVVENGRIVVGTGKGCFGSLLELRESLSVANDSTSFKVRSAIEELLELSRESKYKRVDTILDRTPSKFGTLLTELAAADRQPHFAISDIKGGGTVVACMKLDQYFARKECEQTRRSRLQRTTFSEETRDDFERSVRLFARDQTDFTLIDRFISGGRKARSLAYWLLLLVNQMDTKITVYAQEECDRDGNSVAFSVDNLVMRMKTRLREQPLPLPKHNLSLTVKLVSRPAPAAVCDDKDELGEVLHDRFVCSAHRYFAVGYGLDVLRRDGPTLRIFNTYYCGDADTHAPDRAQITKMTPVTCGIPLSETISYGPNNRTLQLNVQQLTIHSSLS